MVEDIWRNCSVQGCASFRFVHKLIALKNAFKILAKEKREHNKVFFEAVLGQINDLDFKEAAVGLND